MGHAVDAPAPAAEGPIAQARGSFAQVFFRLFAELLPDRTQTGPERTGQALPARADILLMIWIIHGRPAEIGTNKHYMMQRAQQAAHSQLGQKENLRSAQL